MTADIGIQQLDVGSGISFGLSRQARAGGIVIFDRLVMEVVGAQKESQVIPFDVQFVGNLDVGRDDIALVIIEIAVIPIDGVGRTSVGNAD